jgi:hypothetical protein
VEELEGGPGKGSGARLEFEPRGTAFRDHPESHALWRWMGLQAPDLVFIAGDDPSGLGAALSRERVAGVGSIPARALPANGLRDLNATQIERSPAAFEIERRLSRSPRELALELARHYGHEFDTPLYIQALALIGRCDWASWMTCGGWPSLGSTAHATASRVRIHSFSQDISCSPSWRAGHAGWLPAEPYRNAIDRAWQAVLVRTGPEGQLVNVCESTPRMPSVEAYVQRAAVFGTDPRGGAMALLFATEMAGLE